MKQAEPSKTTMQAKNKTLIQIISLTAAAIALQVFVVLLAFLPDVSSRQWLYYLLLAGGSLLNITLYVLSVVFTARGKETLAKGGLILEVFLLLTAVVAYVVLKTGFWKILSDEQLFREFLERAGVWMSLVFILVQFLQVVILPIPSTVTVVAGSALFGPLLGSVYSLIGIVLGSFTAFAVGRLAGYRVVAWLVGKETLDKWLAKIKGKDKIFLSAMFLLPVFPDDVLCFVAGLSTMSFGLFALVIGISRVLAVFTTSYSISLIPFDTWWGLLIWALIAAVVVLVFYLLYKKSDAILNFIHKLFHREVRVKEKSEGDTNVKVVSPEGNLVEKGKGETDPPQKGEESGNAPPKE